MTSYNHVQQVQAIILSISDIFYHCKVHGDFCAVYGYYILSCNIRFMTIPSITVSVYSYLLCMIMYLLTYNLATFWLSGNHLCFNMGPQ